MKRSRMVNLITVALSQLGLTNSPDYDVYDPPTIEQGNKILTIVEKHMLPLSNSNFDDINMWDPETWEPEDDR